MSQPVQPPDSRSTPSKPVIRFQPWQLIGIIGCTIVIVMTGITLVQQDRTPQSTQGIETFTPLESLQDITDPTQPRTFDIPLYGKGGYGIFNETNYSTINGVDMSKLSEAQREKVMYAANNQGCTCGCRMTLAQCISTDSTCPLRSKNLDRARELIASALRGS